MPKSSSAKSALSPLASSAAKAKSHKKTATAKAASTKAEERRADQALLNAWVFDASLEHNPEFGAKTEYKPGERNLNLDIRLGAPQTQTNKHIIQTLQIRCIIDDPVERKVIAVAEITCMGIFDPAHFPAVKEESEVVFHMAQSLWPLARARVSDLMAFAGQTPPLPQEMPRQQR